MTVRLRHVGDPAFAGRVAQAMREEGVEVTFVPPEEQRGVPEIAELVLVYFLCRGGDAAIEAGVAKVRRWLNRRGTIEIENSDLTGAEVITGALDGLRAEQATAFS